MSFDKERKEAVLANIRLGMNEEDSAVEAGISRASYFHHKKKDSYFLDDIKKALLKPKKRCIKKIQTDKSWQSSAWWLERKFPEEFKERKEYEHQGNVTYEIGWKKQKNKD